MAKMMIKKAKDNLGLSDKMFDTMITIFVSVWLLIVLYPLIYVVSSSFSSGEAVTSGRVLLWPVDFSLTGYELVFKNQKVWSGYANTIFYTVVMTFINVVYTIMMAYVLSRKDFQARKLFTTLYLIPMWFGGGMIPKYVLMAKLGLTNSRWGFVLMSGIGISNMIIMRTYFQSSIPGEMLEAGKVDGITDIGYLMKIALPSAFGTASFRLRVPPFSLSNMGLCELAIRRSSVSNAMYSLPDCSSTSKDPEPFAI
jgi:multiple sugar transport system permease protein/putative aldouronate transport system permease protein